MHGPLPDTHGPVPDTLAHAGQFGGRVFRFVYTSRTLHFKSCKCNSCKKIVFVIISCVLGDCLFNKALDIYMKKMRNVVLRYLADLLHIIYAACKTFGLHRTVVTNWKASRATRLSCLSLKATWETRVNQVVCWISSISSSSSWGSRRIGT